ncbi:hypothetical protein [Streptomyces chartreusis]|uniref:hypothetical protein n=1 Tax=Streptomyces chartreusis TaxID=1969 RepID=UPI00364D8C72
MNDSTSDAAIGRITAEQLIARMEQLEISQRALVFAYVGLDISLAALARELEITVAEARTRIQEGLMALRADEDVQLLAGISRAGGRADFHDHIQRLQLEAWFCRWCGGFQVQKGRGRLRLTCSDRCRRERYKITQLEGA